MVVFFKDEVLCLVVVDLALRALHHPLASGNYTLSIYMQTPPFLSGGERYYFYPLFLVHPS